MSGSSSTISTLTFGDFFSIGGISPGPVLISGPVTPFSVRAEWNDIATTVVVDSRPVPHDRRSAYEAAFVIISARRGDSRGGSDDDAGCGIGELYVIPLLLSSPTRRRCHCDDAGPGGPAKVVSQPWRTQ